MREPGGVVIQPPNLWWSAELANEAAGEPLDGLIEGNTFGLFCFQLREWARLASLPADAVELGPVNGTHVVLPEMSWYSHDEDQTPHWRPGGHDISAWPEGVDIDGSLQEDVDNLEANALALLAAIRAHRRMARKQ